MSNNEREILLRKNHTLPEFFSDHEWKVQEENDRPSIDLKNKIMYVPLGAAPHEAFLRVHETAHARWTPHLSEEEMADAYRGVNWECLQAVEDNRLHLLLSRAGVDLSSGGVAPSLRAEYASALSFVAGAPDRELFAVASHGTGDAGILSDPAASAVGARVRAMLEADPSFEAVVAAARELTVAHKRAPGRGPRPTPGESTGTSGLTYRVSTNPYGVYADEGGEGGEAESLPCESMSFLGPTAAGMVPWGKLKVEEPDRPLASCVKKGGFRAEDTGSYLRGPHRLLSDGRIFAVKKRQKTLSVLVDFSGSMNLTEVVLERLLTHVPAAVVAVYSANRADGVLRVLARDGRRVTGDFVRRPSGSANVVDGPCLQWLATQPGPRYWVSDGCVTGVGDMSGVGNTAACAELCLTAKITRVASPDWLLKLIRAHKPHARA